MKLLCVNTAGLGVKTHYFSFFLDTDFLKEYSGGLAPEGVFKAEIALAKQTMLIEADFHIEGTLQLVCDRSLRAFAYPMEVKKKIIFKYGNETKELSEDIMLIDRKEPSVEVGQLLYELIGLAIPIKKLHPDFKNKNTDRLEDEIVYSTSSADKQEINPIWQKLASQHKH